MPVPTQAGMGSNLGTTKMQRTCFESRSSADGCFCSRSKTFYTKMDTKALPDQNEVPNFYLV